MSDQAPTAEAPATEQAPELPPGAVLPATRLERMSMGTPGKAHKRTKYEPIDPRQAAAGRPARRPAHKAKPVQYKPYDEQ
ncbi:hypothetical protein PBI_VALIDUS_105 [Mycobacterium phage Validus]|uniref:Uncharacterized protein n=1 Tax=Mycobacterium phage Validus TaxID=1414747 RepID=V5UQG2_9CAUD|nr:hypothetical protein CC50_gp006 [Mycobacterium phage Validus]AHB79635.1 hypothetical protein PBI_VALIDUS_105 [Mycobacterium phage Validus]